MINFQQLVLIPAILAVVKSDFPFDVESVAFSSSESEEVYRLPEDLDPVNFNVEITPYFEAEGNNEAFTFDGYVEITVTVSII